MSVTFSVENPLLGFTARCSCGERKGTTLYADYPDVLAAIEAGVEALPCEACAECDPQIYAHAVGLFDEAPMLNMSNTNARELLVVLGLLDEHEELVGSLPGAEFAAKVIEALVVAPADLGVPAQSQGNMVFFGRPAGYVQARLADLKEVAEFAWDRGLAVDWS